MKLKLTEESAKTVADNQHIIGPWCDALRSGYYLQELRFMFSDGGYCCLGVLEKINGVSDKHMAGCAVPTDMKVTPVIFNNGKLPQRLRALTEDGCYKPDEWNDRLKLTFNQIADLLEFGEIEIGEIVK